MSDYDSDNQTEEQQQPKRVRRPYVRRPPQPKQQTFDPADSTKLPTHLRHRYWSSWEEMRLVELWRRHSAEVVTLQKNTPIFRVISDGMRQWGFHVNSQECRRKISSLKNKYISERRRVEQENNESEWKLYPLIHCLLVPRIKDPDLSHEIQIVNQLLAKLPPTPEEPKPPAPPTQIANFQSPTPALLTPRKLPYQLPRKIPAPPPPEPVTAAPATAAHLSVKSITSLLDEPAAPAAAASPAKRKYVWRNLPTDAVSYVLKHHFTQPSLDQLRAENLSLEERRDQLQKRLQIEEREYEYLQSFFAQWTRQQEQVLQHLNSNAI